MGNKLSPNRRSAFSTYNKSISLVSWVRYDTLLAFLWLKHARYHMRSFIHIPFILVTFIIYKNTCTIISYIYNLHMHQSNLKQNKKLFIILYVTIYAKKKKSFNAIILSRDIFFYV